MQPACSMSRKRQNFATGPAFGVFSEPLRQRAALALAREAIERAEKIMQETTWPVPEDYN
jgi:hypothetical protein